MRLKYPSFTRWLAAVSVLAMAACGDSTGPDLDHPAPPEFPIAPVQSQYSLSSATLGALASSPEPDGVAGTRWCSSLSAWFDPSAALCGGLGQAPPFGTVVEEEGDLLLAAGRGRAAPFLWTGPPDRENPFPESGDFTLDLRMKIDQIGGYGTGVRVLDWNPAEAGGDNTPLRPLVMQVWGDQHGVRVFVPGSMVRVPGAYGWHDYKLQYEEGAYTLFVDGEHAAGPVESELRPTAVWMGNPIFVEGSANEWTDFRVGQLTVSTPAPEVVEVPVAVKPGGCPSPINMKARGMVPVAILGTDELDVSQIDPATIRLEGVAPVRSAHEDVGSPVEPYVGKTPEDCSADGPDGFTDLTLKFESIRLTDALAGAADGEYRTLSLTGNLLPEHGGTALAGEDVVVVRAK